MIKKNKEIIACAKIALCQNLNLARCETLLVVTDKPCETIGKAFWQVGKDMCREAIMVEITPRKENGNEPPKQIAELFGEFDVVVLATSKSLSHTKARRNGCKKGSRIASLPGITEEMFTRTMKTDWKHLGVSTRTVAARLSSAKKIRIESANGTDFTFETGGRRAKSDDGVINTKGAFGNLPAGEAYLAPLEGTANGRLVFDGSFPFGGVLNEPFTLYVKNGIVTRVTEHVCSNPLRRVFSTYGKDARNIAEFGVGTLGSAIISGNILEDEKVLGTIHVAFGDNASMGGNVQVPIHLDGIMKEPNVYLDNRLWMKAGKILTV